MMDMTRPKGRRDRVLKTPARRSRSVIVRRTLLLIGFVMLAQTGTVQAQRWYDEYGDGLNAIEAQDWARAAERLEAALERRAEQSRDPIRWYATIFRPYIPDFYLAVAYANLGRSNEAVDLLESVQRNGLVVEGDDEFPRFTTVLADARRQVGLAQANALLVEVDTLIADNRFADARRRLTQAGNLGLSDGRLAPYRERIAEGERLAQVAQTNASFDAVMRQAAADLDAGRLAAACRGADEARRLGVRAGEVTALLDRVTGAEREAEGERRVARVAAEFNTLLRETEDHLGAGRFRQARATAARARALGIQPRRVAALLNRVTTAEGRAATARVALEFNSVLRAAEDHLTAGRFGQARAAAARARALRIQPGRVAAFLNRLTSAIAVADAAVLNDQFEALMGEARRALQQDQYAEARVAADSARALGVRAADADELLERIAEAETVASRLEVIVDPPPEVDTAQLERSALLAFYAGDYEAAHSGLDQLISEAPTARAFLFLASSQVAAGLLGSEDQTVWLTAAVEDYRRAVGGGVDPETYREFISPRILQILRDESGR